MTPLNKTQADQRWVTSAILVALATRLIYKGGTFTSTDMRTWVPSLTATMRKSASATLLRLGFVTQEMRIDEKGHSYARYTVTLAGEAAIKSVVNTTPLTSGPKGPHQIDRTPGADTYVQRLWSLMRARGMLDSETAAATLVDAGDDVATAAKTAQRYFARWASTGALTQSRMREANGCKRYVLVKDCGPTPPAWTPKAKARKAAQAAE